ncbi:MAG TPA: (2Fe-2S)-binding protein [Telmatospirillum sp.]|nr:(2Fe-2S)-binding protein [Telmatospirillum sp.]
MSSLSFTLNGKPVSVDVADDRRLIDLLRQDLGLIGSKEGCGIGNCGACTVLVDGAPRAACLTLAAQIAGRHVVTIEGAATSPLLRLLTESFATHGAVQCGYCTPGMIMAAAALLVRTPSPSRHEIRDGMSGNLCRCTGYHRIVDAIEAAAGRLFAETAK